MWAFSANSQFTRSESLPKGDGKVPGQGLNAETLSVFLAVLHLLSSVVCSFPRTHSGLTSVEKLQTHTLDPSGVAFFISSSVGRYTDKGSTNRWPHVVVLVSEVYHVVLGLSWGTFANLQKCSFSKIILPNSGGPS